MNNNFECYECCGNIFSIDQEQPVAVIACNQCGTAWHLAKKTEYGWEYIPLGSIDLGGLASKRPLVRLTKEELSVVLDKLGMYAKVIECQRCGQFHVIRGKRNADDNRQAD